MAIDESTYFDNSDDFVEFLQNSLIPDLRSTGMDATAQDFVEAIYWIKHYKEQVPETVFNDPEVFDQES